ncbi:MAG: CDP-alcohol phosphatidyltransferase family protein [Lysobacterales bacterium]
MGRWLPNALSLLRALAALPIAWLIVQQQWLSAFWLALAAGSTDLLDGWLAKRYGWQSRLGAALDGLADKALLLAVFVALVWIGRLPTWWLLLVLGRDSVIVLGSFAYHRLIEPLQPQPSALGKAATFSQLVLALGLMLDGVGLPSPPRLTATLLWLAATLTLASGVHYVVLWVRRAVRHRANAQREVSNEP